LVRQPLKPAFPDKSGLAQNIRAFPAVPQERRGVWVASIDLVMNVRNGSKSGKAQNEQTLSVLPAESGLRSAR
jgi:hypothetical protein